MKIKNVVLLALDKLFFQKKLLILNIVLLCISLFSMGELLFSQAMNSYARDICERTLTAGIEETGLIRINGTSYFSQEAQTSMQKFMQEAEASDVIYSIGSMTKGKIDRLPELAEMQRNFSDIPVDDELLSWIFMDRTALKLCKLSFREVQEVDEDKWNAANWFGIYLGANFKNIPVGTRYVEEVVPGTEWIYEVVGILEESCGLISDSVFVSGIGSGLQTCIPLDSMVICINQIYPPGSAGWGFAPEDGVTLSEAKEYLTELAEKYGLSVSFASLEAGLAYEEREQKRVESILKEVFIMVFAVTFVVDTCIFLVQFLNHIEEYGIFYAMGISKQGMIGILLVENMLKCLFAFLFTWGILWAYVSGDISINTDPAIWYALKDIMYHGIFQKLLLVEVLSLVAITVIPALTLNYSKPVSMLRGTRT